MNTRPSSELLTRNDVSFAVVVPMYNEATGAERFVRAALSAIDRIAQRHCLIVVDDGSIDGTGDILNDLRPEFPELVLLKHPRNVGYGAGLVTGARFAVDQAYEYALFMDSDLTNPPDHIDRFVDFMEQGFDLIKGCRYCPDGAVEGVPAKAYWISRIGNLVARVLFGGEIRDSTNGFRAIRTEMFLDMPLLEPGFALIVEELMWARRRGLTLANVPTTLYSRATEQRPSLFDYSLPQMVCYLKYALAARFASNR
jgi:glycosyltransferase involved in cell wall biosynthesis